LELRKRIVAGEDFAEVAQKESDDTASGAKGGDLGAFGRGQMIPVFEQAAFALQPGQLSDPVKSQFGYHLIKLESKDVKPFAEIRAGLENQLKQAQIQRAVDELVKKTPVVMDPAFFPPSPSK
jgi:parvulin-like peptidyl-prolyl isomerase